MPVVPYNLLRPFLFALPPESAHHIALSALRIAARCPPSPPVVSPKTVMGLSFSNPLGLAAGLDKNADSADALSSLGFGFVEVGALTPRPQSGNNPPRLFRVPPNALVNRMGFNNCGMAEAAKRLSSRRGKYILGINLGKNADTPQDKAGDDYASCLEHLYPHGDFFTVNISSPNTEGLRDLQTPAKLSPLLRDLHVRRDELAKQHGKRAPLAVKLSPDMSESELESVAGVIADEQMDGVIACNTTTSRPEGFSSSQAGGLSGAPLTTRALEMTQQLRRFLPSRVAVIGVGGIMNEDNAKERLDAGADLIQLYTGLIYAGPGLPRRILRRLEQ